MSQSPYPSAPSVPAPSVPAPSTPDPGAYPPPPAGSPYAAYPTVGYGPVQTGTPMVVRTNSLSVVALVTGIIGFVGLPVIFGHLALRAIKRTGERGSAFAIIGLVLGYVQIAAVLVVVLISALGALGVLTGVS